MTILVSMLFEFTWQYSRRFELVLNVSLRLPDISADDYFLKSMLNFGCCFSGDLMIF